MLYGRTSDFLNFICICYTAPSQHPLLVRLCGGFDLTALLFISNISVWGFFSIYVLRNLSLMSCVSVFIVFTCLCSLGFFFRSFFYSLSSLKILILLLSYLRWGGSDFIQFTLTGCHYYRVIIFEGINVPWFSCYLCIMLDPDIWR